MARTWQGVAAALVMGLALHPASAAAQTHPAPQRTRATANIIGGTDAVGSSLGMVAEIEFNDGSEDALCSGTVVASNMILTAGHCAENTDTEVVDAADSYVVLTGTQSNSTSGQVSGVTQVIPDPNFDPETLSADAALLVLSTPTTVAPVELATDPGDAGLYDAGSITTIAGWGVIDDENDLPNDLQYGADVVQSASVCAQAVSGGAFTFDAQLQLCADDDPSYRDGACNGDSGGPMLSDNDGTWVEIGLTSYGPVPCDTSQPTFYTRTDALSSWIQQEIAANPHATATPPTSSAPVTTSPAAAPTPPTTTVPATTTTARRTAPPAGVYSGHTTQGKKIALTLDPAGTAIDDAIFHFRLTCPRHRHLSAGVAARVGWRLTTAHATGFADSFRDGSGARYRLTGTFSSSGRATGTLRITDTTARDGSCTSGAVRWSART